jgi:hypothetical protein
MTITICSGLIVFPQKLIVSQIGKINCLKSQVDCFLTQWMEAGPASTLIAPSRTVTQQWLLPFQDLRQGQTEDLGS